MAKAKNNEESSYLNECNISIMMRVKCSVQFPFSFQVNAILRVVVAATRTLMQKLSDSSTRYSTNGPSF